MAKSHSTMADLVRGWKHQGVTHVQFELPDMHGVSRSKIIPIGHAEDYAAKGLNMYGGTVTLDTASSVVPGTLYNEEVNYADQLLRPDLETALIVPWLENTARLICNGEWEDGTPHRAAPRWLLGRLLEKADEMGFEVKVGLEYEFYLFRPEPGGTDPYFGGLHIFNTLRNRYEPVIDRVLDEMPRAGIDIITANCEYAPSQFEINFAPAVGMAAADSGFTFKNGVKTIAHQMGYNATFMTKPLPDDAANGCHIHISLADRRTGENSFLDQDDPDGLSQTARMFIQGMLDHTPASMALLAPTINCYSRFVPHHFAPSNISWGPQDRSAAVRAKNSRDDNTHLENRLGTGLANPYLAVAGVLATGLLGLERGEPAATPDPAEGPVEDAEGYARLPATLEESLAALETDREFAEMLGEEFVTVYTVMRRHELGRFRAHITDWERGEYLEVY